MDTEFDASSLKLMVKSVGSMIPTSDSVSVMSSNVTVCNISN